jgi:hypothetical protein
MRFSKRFATIACIVTAVLMLALCFNLAGYVNHRRPAKPLQAVDLVKVKILEQCHEDTGDGKTRPWWLIEVDDGQRCYIHNYLGKPGDQFSIWSDKLEGYHRLPQDGIQLPPVASAHAEAPAELPKVVITGVPPIYEPKPSDPPREKKGK